MSHLLNCNECPTECDMKDLQATYNKAVKVAEYWSHEKNYKNTNHTSPLELLYVILVTII